MDLDLYNLANLKLLWVSKLVPQDLHLTHAYNPS